MLGAEEASTATLEVAPPSASPAPLSATQQKGATNTAAVTPSAEPAPDAHSASPANRSAPPPDAAPAPSVETAAPVASADPIVVAIRARLDDPAVRKSATSDDLAALKAFYAERAGAPLWITGMGFSARAQAVITEIENADDWGLSADAFDLPPGGGSSGERRGAGL